MVMMTTVTEREGFVAVESKLFSLAQRHLQVSFGATHVTRGDGCVLFDVAPLEGEDGEEVGGRLGDEVQRLCSTLVREVTGATSLRLSGEDSETDFASLKTRTRTFSSFMAEFATLGVSHSALESLPDLPHVQHMLEMLYVDVVADATKGVIVVKDFPKPMCPAGARLDVILGKTLCVQVYSKTEKTLQLGVSTALPNADASTAQQKLPQGPLMKVWIDLRALANAIAPYSTTSIESELPPQWRQKTFTLPEASEVLKIAYKALNAYWSRGSHNERTKVNAMSLLSIVSGDLREYIKGQILLESSDWRGPWRINLDHLEKALELIREWGLMTRALKEAKWADWDVGDFHDEDLRNFAGRLQDVVQIRKLLESASKLLQGKLQDSIAPEVIFEEESLTNLKKTSNERWAACMANFEKEFSFLEDNLRGRVKQLFSSQSQESDAFIRLLQQHGVLVQREGIRASIKRDFDAARDLLIQKLKEVMARYQNNKRRATTDLQILRIAKSCQVECAQVPESAVQLFAASEELDAVVEAARGFMQEAQKDEDEVLASWKQSMEAQCRKIMEVPDAVNISSIDKDHLVCTVNPLIRQILQEISSVRTLCGGQSNGARLSGEAECTVESGGRLLKAATRTMQIVANYNTVQRQILRCTRPMLEHLSEHAVGQILYTGADTLQIPVANYHELEGLNLRFQKAVETLSSDNRRIRRFHCDFINQVVALHNVELARHTEQWRTAVDGLRRSFNEFLYTHSFDHYDTWQCHLDAQIYKALEHQYQRGLESLHEKMREFNVELVFKQGQIHFKPSFEAMREAYYANLRDLVSIPLRFRGLQEKQESGGPYKMYKVMPLANRDRLVTVHLKAVELFTKLNRVRKAFRTQIAVGACGINGAPDIDTVVDAVCKTLQQFVDAFGVVKEQMRKLQSIEDTIKVDCFTISTIPVKVNIEDQLHRLEESLLKAMRRAMQKTLLDVDNFVFNASNIITRQPVTMEEVGQANKAYYHFFDTMPSYEAQLAEVGQMNAVLRQHSGAAIDLSGTKSRWEHLREAMSSHHKIIDASVSKMRVSLDDMIQKHMKSGQRFATKWEKQKRQLIASFKDGKVEQIRVSLEGVKFHLSEMEELEAQGRDLELKCEYFKLPRPNFKKMKAIVKDVAHISAMRTLYDNFNETLAELRKEDWLTFRSHIYLFDDFIKEWRDKLSAEGSPETRASDSDGVVQYLQNLLNEWTNCVPLLRFVRGDGMMTEHWNEMFRVLGMEKGMKSSELTFGDILDHYKQVIAKEAELKHLHARVQGEVQIRDALQDLRAWALEATFKLVTSTDSAAPVVRLITDWKETLTQVSENQALISSLKDSPFFVHFSDEVGGWEAKLAVLFEALTLMNTIQRKWTYLEPIFARGALPQEQARFKRVDKEFVSIFREVEADPRVMSIVSHMDIVDRLKGVLEQMEYCQKSLMEFLETKRENFPRFYFISDDDMLEILGHSKNPTVIQTHLKKLFMGINSVLFSDDEKAITHMVSADRETVPLIRPVSIEDDDVEKWLVRLDECMRETLQELLIACVQVVDPTEIGTIEAYPSQVLQVTIQLKFSRAVEDSIKRGNKLNLLKAGLQNSMNQLTLISSDVGQVTMLKVKALVLDIIHQIEIVELLLSKGVKSVDEWWWQKQLRYYMRDDKRCIVAMMDTEFDYTYEYQGNAAKLVHTPLTDKCFLVLTKGMQLGYGGNPYGPAGTGKTESVKALGTAMGRQVLVFNCDEGIDFKAMGRIFIGIVKCGAWGCFDEFNRLKIDQLSAISQMIQVIQETIKNRGVSCSLLNRVVRVSKNAGIFVTLNPAGKGYGGRTKLPDNLKQLFREIAMSVPDNELITSTMLLSEGFTHARELSKKIVELYRLSGQLMSRQQHYDWGLRSLKAVLRLAGTLVQKWKLTHDGKQATEEEEAELILQSLDINMLSKLTLDDAHLFKGLKADIFPKVATHKTTYGELEAAIEVAVRELELQLIPAQVQKVLQLHETMNQRMGVVLVGPSGSGKSTLFRILRKALQVLHVEVPLHVMNPKAVPRPRLLGYMDPDTREWFDGVLSFAAREVVKWPKESRPWILCDGDIDPEWIESLNSVLDDNKLLTLPNGVRIQFGNNVNFLFETHTLTYASPATISRMGVILLSENDVALDSVVVSFLQKQSAACRDLIAPLINKYLIPAVEEVCKSADDLVVSTTRVGVLNCCLSHVLQSVNEEDFVLSLIRGLNGMLWPNGAKALANTLFEMSRINPLSSKRPFDTYYNRETGQLAEFKADLRVDVSPESLLSGRAVIHTVEVQRLLATLEPLVADDRCHPLFLVGPAGCGKSITLLQCFAHRSNLRITEVHCNAQTTSLHLIQKLEQLCTLSSTSNGHVYRPKESERLVFILKNVNLPKPDKYGTVELHAFLLQLFMYHGFYNDDLEWIGVEKVQFVASMNPTASAGRYAVTPRLLASVGIVFMPYPSHASLIQIYTTYFTLMLKSAGIAVESEFERSTGLANFVVGVFEKISRHFGGEENAHCLFSPRSITNWVTNILMYAIDAQLTTLPAVLSHEAVCIFADCLSRTEDHLRAEKIISEMLATIGYSSTASTSASQADKANPVVFVSWFSEVNERGEKPLKGVPYETAAAELERGLLKYNREFKALNIHVIPEVVSWITRVDRVLARPVGHMILVGHPGVGRRDAVFLAAYMLRIEVVTLNMMQGYGVKSFRQDLKQFVQRATTQNERMVLLLEDHNIVDESFLEIVNGLVSSGEVPGLFSPEELETMFSSIREEAASDGYIGTIYSYFLMRLRRNLRVALIMDDRHALFLVRLQSNPGFLSNCDMLWMGTWSNSATRSICKKRLQGVIQRIEADPGNKGFHLHRELFAIHEMFGSEATPARFHMFMVTYEALLQKKSENSEADLKRLEAGLTKLHEAEASVEKIQRDVTSKKEQVEVMQRGADSALAKIQKKMLESKEQRDSATELQERLRVEHEEIIVKRQKVENELGDIKPSLEAAREAVSSIRSEQLNEIRSLKAPPEPVRDVLEGVLALLGVTDVSWQSMRKFLGERGAKERILDFDAGKVTPAIRENIARLLHQKATSFKPEVIHRASVAAAPMAAWVQAMVSYSTILERIAPLTQQLHQLEANQKTGEEQLHALQNKLKQIDEAVEELRREFSEKCKEAERLKDTFEKAHEELSKACDLLEKLSSEKTRWAQDAEKIRTNNRMLPKRALIAAAFMTYIARETEDARQRYFKQWSERLHLPAVATVTGFMRDESVLLQWKAEGLPGDELSQENAITMLDALQTPLVIDPANQAIEWVKTHLQNKKVVMEVTSLRDERFTHTLELAVRFGKTLLVVDVDSIAPILYPVLRRDLLSVGAKSVVQIGNKQVDWQDTFRIMLFTRRTDDIALPPGAASLVVEVNFSVTRFGLENQLLGITIQHERPELEQQRADLVKKEENFKLELSKLEVQLLTDLATSQGDLLENTTLIGALNDVKMQSSKITEALQQSHALQVELDEKRDVYRPFASKGSMIFFLVKDMEKLNRMYHFGLNDFVGLFVDCLNAYKGSSDVEHKMFELTLSFAQKCYFHVSLALLKRDRIVFGMHLVRGLFPDEFATPLWNVLVGAKSSSINAGDDGKNGNVSIPSWVPATACGKFTAIVSNELAAERMQLWKLHDVQRWGDWMLESAPEEELAKSPGLNLMDHLLLINTFRPDRLMDLLQLIIMRLLQLDTLVPVTSLEDTVSRGSASTPIILITSRGADPGLEVQDVALRLVGKQRFTQIALGGGQTEDAVLHLRRCAAQGDWLFLKNLHLVLDWASVLEKELGAMPNPNPAFRLIITTEPHDLFPTVLLRMSAKVAVEAPPGLKQNLLRSYTTWDESFLNGKEKMETQILFGLAWFHALLQERRNYVPQGWMKFYEFSPADLKSAADIIAGECAKSRSTLDWTTLHGLLQECIYGGRLENPRDEEVLAMLVSNVFNDDALIACSKGLYGTKTRVPTVHEHDAILKFIRDHMPDSDHPSILGLPENADRAVKEQLAVHLCEDLRPLTNPSQVCVAAKEAWRTLLVPVLEMWSISGLSEERKSQPTSPGDANMSPMKVFFLSELDLLTEIIANLGTTFGELRCVVEGSLIPPPSLREEAMELIDGRAPQTWLDQMDGPKEAKLWLACLRQRLTTMTEYVRVPFTSLTAPFNLVNFLRPQTFLNALRQFTARTTGEPLVGLSLVASVGSGGVADGLQLGVKLSGESICLQGASLDAHGGVTLADARSPSSSPLGANVVVRWVSAPTTGGMARIPLYTSAARTTAILDLFVPCKSAEMSERLLLGGVAAFLMPV